MEWTQITEPGARRVSLESEECPAFLSEQVITYLGNKRSLLPLIEQAVLRSKSRLGQRKLRSLDLFSGSGIVARYLKQHSSLVIANDLEAYSEAVNRCFLTNRSEADLQELERVCQEVHKQALAHLEAGFITELYAPRDQAKITANDRCFYTRSNAQYLDTVSPMLRELPEGQRRLLLGPLLAAASVHTNTAGVFKGFYKNAQGIGQFGGDAQNALSRILGDIALRGPVLSRFDAESLVCREDANLLVEKLDAVDLAYLDPPYNQHPYGSNYFMLNLLVDYQRPTALSRVSGIPPQWNRSAYNRRQDAARALFELVRKLKARQILISYNSEGFVPYGEFVRELEAIGRLEVLETQYNAFRGSRNLHARPTHVKEFLFLLEKSDLA